MSKVTLPSSFEIKVKDSGVVTAINHVIDNFSTILKQNGGLFPEYTDHGPEHIQAVLQSAEKIITEQSRSLLTAEDIYVLTVAIFLHDCAMTFSWDDLIELISNCEYSKQVRVGYLSAEDKPWSDLWSEFEQEFKNYSQDDLIRIVGDNVALTGSVMEHFPQRNEQNLTESKKKVAGEFVRRHHARIAHIIAEFGHPRLGSKVFHDSQRNLDYIAGFIARSHNESMRLGHDRLRKANRHFEYQKCHPVFLMSVLRIADLMQITQHRTPLLLFRLTKFWSTFSKEEWERHLAILGIKNATSDDPSCMRFEISHDLRDARQLSSIHSLLSYFQHELDSLWAVLGETYGFHPSLSKLGIQYRRVASELDDPDFINFLGFLDSPARFQVDLSLIGKLITPLYGNVPEIGIRELLQNGLDSVRERRHIFPTIKNKVVVHVYKDGESEFLTIKDEGCGMDANIIRNYFLNIGSSYRQSKLWAQTFTLDRASKVNRSGRFGIGMLAGFILGDKIKVTTRKYDATGNALKFEFGLTSDLIQLDKVSPLEGVSIGTEITIQLKVGVYERLVKTPEHWQWYCDLDNQNDVHVLINNQTLPADKQTHSGFYQIKQIQELEKKFGTFRWTYEHRNSQAMNMLFVNGLKIAALANTTTRYRRTLDTYDAISKCWGFDINFPAVFMSDPNLELPLNLERNGFSEDSIPYGEVLLKHVIDGYLREVHNFGYEVTDLENLSSQLRSSFSGLVRNQQDSQSIGTSISLFGLHKKGLIFSDIHLLLKANIKKILIIDAHVTSSVALDQVSEDTSVFRLLGDMRTIQDGYANRNFIPKESRLIQTLHSNCFIHALFGQNSGVSALDKSAYTLFISKERYSKIDLSKVIDQYKLNTKEVADIIGLSCATDFQVPELSLHERDIAIFIDLTRLSNVSGASQLSKRWISELTSPFLNKETKLIDHH